MLVWGLCALQATAQAQGRRWRVLFVGNSYTATNDLPAMLARLVAAGGDTLVYDASTPGGFTFQGHTTLPATVDKIRQGGWDRVVLQEQSQRPAFPQTQVEATVFPFARRLDSLARAHNPQGRTYFYITWGRQSGDASNCAFYPPLCTYAGMDSLLRARYEQMADQTGAALAPAGPVWRRIRRLHPNLGLYASDGSHPSVAGTYAAACAHYATLFAKDPSNLPTVAGLAAADAALIRAAAKTVAFDSLAHWRVAQPTGVAHPVALLARAYPNPVQNWLHLPGAGGLYDAAGVLRAQGAAPGLDVGHLPPGLYYWRGQARKPQPIVIVR